MNQRILALSSSRTGNGGYLEAAAPMIGKLLGTHPLTAAFIPFASVDTAYENYTHAVSSALPAIYNIITVMPGNAWDVIASAEAIITGGGNTFKLLHDLYKANVMDLIKEKINNGTPYIGWSAGANITGATIGTTNDMPIIDPGTFRALGFFPFQINPHYHNIQLPGFNGETRDQRLQEFITLHPAVPVIALPEGTALLLDNGTLQLTGAGDAILFTNRNNQLLKKTLPVNSDLTCLLQ
ncbi:MAG TPA: dipeptidase PepE [Chitinophagaceae bacterium]|nr:dipeptidase PepE [Chitinophagaceae bacterium]